MKIFLDDIRSPTDCAAYMYKRIGKDNPIYTKGDWYIVRNYTQFVQAIMKYAPDIDIVSFDHDLADEHYTPEMYNGLSAYEQSLLGAKEKTGKECADFLKEYYELCKYSLPEIFIHSMNPVGCERIKNVFS